jgi:aerobic carbon-monoxide dehydrogenase medium subunit
MYPAPIESLQNPTTINEVLRQLTATGDKDTLAIAGGMSLMQAMKARVLRPDALIDLNGISELRGITREGRDLRIGAMTRYVDLASAPELQDGAFAAIADAARHVGDRQVRNRGTLDGSRSTISCLGRRRRTRAWRASPGDPGSGRSAPPPGTCRYTRAWPF